MAGPDPYRLDLRRAVVDPRVAEDGLQHMSIIIAALTGRITRKQAAQAVGYTVNDLNAAIANAGSGGEDMARAAIARNFVFIGLWAHHARQAQARNGSERT